MRETVDMMKMLAAHYAGVAVRVPVFFALWALAALVRFPLAVLGFVVVPVALRFSETVYGPLGDEHERLPRWAWLWDNDEDGIDGPPWYRNGYALKHPVAKHFPRFWWLAVRNPVNNLRFVRPFMMVVDSRKVDYIGDRFRSFSIHTARTHRRAIWFLAWQGWRAGFWLIRPRDDGTHLRIRIGWKVTPWDSYEPVEGRTVGVGFQFMLRREG